MAVEMHRTAPVGPFVASRSVGPWATTHFGLISTEKLVALGVSDKAIRTLRREGHLLESGRRGLHRVGHAAFVPGQREAIALAGGGRGAALTGRAHLAWQGLLGPLPRHEPVHVLAPSTRARTEPGAIYTRTTSSFAATSHRGLRCCGVPRALLDFAATDPPVELLREALVAALRRRVDLEPLHTAAAGRRGALLLRAELEQLFPDLARTLSELEARFLRLLNKHALPLAQVNASHHGDLLDCRWPSSRLVVELDGRRWHEHRFREDRARDRRRLREGLIPMRFTWQDVTQDEQAVLADIAAFL